MNFEEYAAKPLLAAAGIAIPEGYVAETAQKAGEIKAALGSCVVKAQVPSGKRGKAGGIKLISKPNEAKAMAKVILGMKIGGHLVVRNSALVGKSVELWGPRVNLNNRAIIQN